MHTVVATRLSILMLLIFVACIGCAKNASSEIEKLARDRGAATKPGQPDKSASSVAQAAKPAPVVPAKPVDSNLLSKEDFPDETFRRQIWELRRPNREKTLMKDLFAKDKTAAIPHLIKALEQEDANIRTQAAKILVGSKLRTTTIEAALVGLISEEKDEDVLANVLSFIDSYRSDKIAVILHRYLTSHENKMVRAYSAAALGTYRYKKAKKDLVTALRDPESWVRLMALGAMKKFKDRSTLPAVRPLLKDENDRVRKRAKETVKLLGG